MKIQTTVTQIRGPEDVKSLPESGMYIHGLFLEGAAWELGNPGQSGYLIEQKLKELHPRLPVVNVIAVKTEDFLTLAQYTCPVYVTSMRGPTFIFQSNLQMESEESDPKKWILAGVCLLMNDD
jgi:dynein heavy chain